MKKEKMKKDMAEMEIVEKREPDEYEISSALDTLHKASKIKKDTKMMAYLKKHAKEKLAACCGEDDEMEENESVSSISDIKNKANKMASMDYDD